MSLRQLTFLQSYPGTRVPQARAAHLCNAQASGMEASTAATSACGVDYLSHQVSLHSPRVFRCQFPLGPHPAARLRGCRLPNARGTARSRTSGAKELASRPRRGGSTRCGSTGRIPAKVCIHGGVRNHHLARGISPSAAAMATAARDSSLAPLSLVPRS